MAKTQLFAWEAYNKGEDAAHLQANPTQVELARKQFHSTKEKMLAAKKKKRLEKYGGQEHLTQQSHQERFGEESRYVEYDQRGNVVKGYEKAAPKSKYVEDQHPHGHTSVWVSKKEISNYECISWKVHFYLIILSFFFKTSSVFLPKKTNYPSRYSKNKSVFQLTFFFFYFFKLYILFYFFLL